MVKGKLMKEYFTKLEKLFRYNSFVRKRRGEGGALSDKW